MRIRYKIAGIAILLSCITIGVWRGLTVQTRAVNQSECDIHNPLSTCAAEPEYGVPAGDLLVVGGPELASASVSEDDQAIIRFTPKAVAADITEFLVAYRATLVDGPRMGGLYTIKLHESGRAMDGVIKKMQTQSEIVDFIAKIQ
jgi:hypothetical protein